MEVPLGDWALEVGPVKVGQTRLHIMLTDTPVVISLKNATVYARQRPGETAPKIFIEEASAEMLEPKPLPNPIPIPYATAIVALSGLGRLDLTFFSGLYAAVGYPIVFLASFWRRRRFAPPAEDGSAS